MGRRWRRPSSAHGGSAAVLNGAVSWCTNLRSSAFPSGARCMVLAQSLTATASSPVLFLATEVSIVRACRGLCFEYFVVVSAKSVLPVRLRPLVDTNRATRSGR